MISLLGVIDVVMIPWGTAWLPRLVVWVGIIPLPVSDADGKPCG